MTERLRQYARVAALRSGQERLREVELARARARVTALDAAISAVADARAQTTLAGRDALLTGARDRWWIADGSVAFEARQMEALTKSRADADTVAEQARGSFREARMQAERAKLLRDLAEDASRILEDRRAQNESDDRFAGRSHWRKHNAKSALAESPAI